MYLGGDHCWLPLSLPTYGKHIILNFRGFVNLKQELQYLLTYIFHLRLFEQDEQMLESFSNQEQDLQQVRFLLFFSSFSVVSPLICFKYCCLAF